MKIMFKLDTETIQQIALFESITGAKVSDCLLNGDRIIFIVAEGNIGKAIGKGGVNIKKFEKRFNKKIEIIEFNKDPIKFAKNILRPIKIKSSELVNQGTSLNINIMSIQRVFPSKKVKKAKTLLMKYFPDIKVVNITI